MTQQGQSRRHLRFGELELIFDGNGTFAREIRLAGEELFRGIGFVVRDANWGTPALAARAEVEEHRGEAKVHAAGELAVGASDLSWSVDWAVTEGGLAGRATASSGTGFSTNRTGFVVLHGLGATRGRPVRVTHPDGRIEETAFPDLVSPHQPFFDIAALEYETRAGHRLRVTFEGEVFEIEDQRNWTDASYKTYCRPLRLPYPYRIAPGQPVAQVVRLEVLAPAPRRSAAAAAGPTAGASAPLPKLGTSMPPGPLPAGAAEALRALNLNFTAVEIDLEDAAWQAGAMARIEAAPDPVRIDIRQAATVEMIGAVAALAPKLAGRSVAGLSLWGADDGAVAQARRLLPGVAVGGGTGAFFTELNRMTAWPASADYLAWTSNPTVHGFDDDTIGETTEPLGDIMRSALAKLPVRRFQIGPMTLGLRYNPNATTPEGRRQAAAPDERQGGPIAAAWLAATLAGFFDPAVEALSFFEPAGPKGLIDGHGRWTPAAHLIARLARHAGQATQVLAWDGQARLRGLLIEAPAGKALCLALPRAETLTLALPAGPWSLVEELTADGFVSRGAPAAAGLEITGFTVLWLTQAA